MKKLFDDVDWPLVLRRSSLIAAFALLVVSYVGFNSGLNFNGEWYVASAIWLAFTVIQFIGNYQENHIDWLFMCVWVFTYLVGIGAGTWAAYGWIGIDNVYIHWMCAIGLGGSAELIPERLIALFVRSMKVEKKPWGDPKGYSKPTAPAIPIPASFRQPGQYKPQHKPQSATFSPNPPQYHKTPKYQNLNTDPMRGYEEPNF